MGQMVAIAAGGALGALMRFWVSGWVYSITGKAFPWGTLAVNVVGSALMGFCYVWLVERSALGPEWRAFLMVGLLGALTTFSTFSIETLGLIEDGEAIRALLNAVVSVVLCVGAAWFAVVGTRSLW